MSYLCLILFPIIATTVAVNYRTVDSVITYTNQMSQASFLQMRTNVNNLFIGLTNYVNAFSMETPLITYLTTQYDSDSLERYTTFSTLFDNYAIRFPITSGHARKLSIYTSNITVAGNNSFIIHMTPSDREAEWYRQTVVAQGQSTFLDVTEENQQMYLNIGKDLQPFSESSYKNLLILRLPETELYSLIENESPEKSIFILSPSNKVLSSSERDYIGMNADKVPTLPAVLNAINGSEGEFKLGESTVYYYTNTKADAIYGIKIISIVNSGTMRDSVKEALSWGLFMGFAIILATILFLFFLSKSIVMKLRLLVSGIDGIKSGNLSVESIAGAFKSEDEITDLYRSLRDMVGRIDTLIYEVYALDLERKDAEIKSLQSQINPHFVFNTMESIRMSLLKNGDTENSEIIWKFSNLLRTTISWDSAVITIYRETELAETYLQILKYRYKDKLSYSVDIDEELYSCHIPKFTLQPLVENAVAHGVERKKGESFIHITGRKEADAILLVVEDDGGGMDEETTLKVRQALSDCEGGNPYNRIGLRNVHRRIVLYYGPEYGVRFSTQIGKGTRVEIRLPLPPGTQAGEDKQ
jgi:two-component system sensor histidine kinase YesM